MSEPHGIVTYISPAPLTSEREHRLLTTFNAAEVAKFLSVNEAAESLRDVGESPEHVALVGDLNMVPGNQTEHFNFAVTTCEISALPEKSQALLAEVVKASGDLNMGFWVLAKDRADVPQPNADLSGLVIDDGKIDAQPFELVGNFS